jgi:hypothetical protein
VEEAIKELVLPLMPVPKSGDYIIHLGKEQPPLKTAATWENDLHYKGLALALKWRGLAAVDVLAKAVTSALEVPNAWAASYTEAWTGCGNTSGGALTCQLNWSEPIGTASACGITSNQAACAGALSDVARADHDTASDDVDAQFTIGTITRGSGTDVFFGVIARKDSGATNTYYFFEAEQDAVTSVFWLSKRVAGTRTDLGSDSTDPANGDVIKLRTDGSNITGYINGTPSSVGTVSDSAITGNTRAGFRYSGSDATSSATADNFSVQDVSGAAGGGAIRRRAI